MEPNQRDLLGAKLARCGASGKLCNDTDGRIWPTEGRHFRPAGHRYDPLVVNQTTAWLVPCQQT